MATLTPQAQSGLEYLKTINPSLASSIQKSFSPSSTTPVDASILGSTPTIAVPPPKEAPIPNYQGVQVTAYRDNPDGTTTNTLSDGTTSTVTYSKGADGSLIPTEVPQDTTVQIGNTAKQDQLDAERTGIVTDVNSLYAKQATKSAVKAGLETAQNLPQLNSQLNEINQQIRSVQSEALAATNTSEDRRAPMFAIRGEQAAIERQRAVKVYGLSAAAEAIQGNISLANDNVQRALDAEFGGLEQEIENKKFLLQVNSDNFDREEKRQAEQRQIELDRQKEELAQRRADKQSIFSTMLAAAQSGADNETLQRIQSATTPEQAISYAGTVLGSKFQQDVAQQQFENALAIKNYNLNVRKTDLDEAKQNADLQQLYGFASGASPEATAYAQQYAATGQIPSGLPKGTFGTVAQLAKELPKATGTIVDRNTGIKSSAVSETLQGGYSSIYSAIELAKQLKELDTKRMKGITAGTLGKVFGSEDQQRYIDLKGQIVDLLARARSGAALTVDETKTYGDMLPGRFANPLGIGVDTQSRIDNFISALSSDLDNKTRSQGLSIYGFSTVNVGGQVYKVGDTVKGANGQSGIVLPDGNISVPQSSQPDSTSPQAINWGSLQVSLGSPLSKANNNPGNLRFVGQPGATQGKNGFARFETPQAGVEALARQIQLDASRHLTLANFISKFAPPSENDTKQYIQQIAAATGTKPTTPISSIPLATLLKAMAHKESSSVINFA
jgi:hypothetical protein